MKHRVEVNFDYKFFRVYMFTKKYIRGHEFDKTSVGNSMANT